MSRLWPSAPAFVRRLFARIRRAAITIRCAQATPQMLFQCSNILCKSTMMTPWQPIDLHIPRYSSPPSGWVQRRPRLHFLRPEKHHAPLVSPWHVAVHQVMIGTMFGVVTWIDRNLLLRNKRPRRHLGVLRHFSSYIENLCIHSSF